MKYVAALQGSPSRLRAGVLTEQILERHRPFNKVRHPLRNEFRSFRQPLPEDWTKAYRCNPMEALPTLGFHPNRPAADARVPGPLGLSPAVLGGSGAGKEPQAS